MGSRGSPPRGDNSGNCSWEEEERRRAVVHLHRLDGRSRDDGRDGREGAGGDDDDDGDDDRGRYRRRPECCRRRDGS